MSDFLDELRKNAKTTDEFLSQQKIAEENEKIEREKFLLQKEIEEKKIYEEFMKNFAQDIKKLCIEAVEECGYINIDSYRYILCEIALKHWYVYGGGEWSESTHKFYAQFRCFKLEKDSVFSSKRVYKEKVIEKEFSAPGCKQSGHTHYKAPEYLNLYSLIKKNIDGYTDIIELPKKLVDKNYPGIICGGSSVNFTEILSSLRFAIKF